MKKTLNHLCQTLFEVFVTYLHPKHACTNYFVSESLPLFDSFCINPPCYRKKLHDYPCVRCGVESAISISQDTKLLKLTLLY